MKGLIRGTVIFLMPLLFFTGCSDDTDYASRSDYKRIDIQEMHNDYDSNEISADNKYANNYYYFTEEVSKVEEFWGDTYLEFMFSSQNPTTKTSGIEITAYFADKDMLLDVKKGDLVTVFCKFKGRTVENYMGTSGYSLHSCHLGDHFSEN